MSDILNTGILERIRHTAAVKTVFLLFFNAAVFPVFFLFLDIPAVEYCKYKLSGAIVHAAALTDNFDDFILIGFILAAVVIAIRDRKINTSLFQKLIFPPVAAAFAGIITHILKTLFGRWRPKGYLYLGEYGFEWFSHFKSILASYPSGHSSSIMAIMTAFVLINTKPAWRPACYIFAIILACMRIVVCAHYPSDVIAGVIQGYLCTIWLYCFLVKKGLHPAPTGNTIFYSTQANS